MISTAHTYGFWLGSFFHSEKMPAFALLAGLVITFLGLRLNTRLIRRGVSWWPGNIRRGSVHVHHVAIGLPAMFVIGVLEFTVSPGSPWVEILALCFGGAAAAVFDEFALVLHLKDVYWEREGHKSIVAVFLGVSFTAFMTVGMIPLGYSGRISQSIILEWVAIGTLVLNLVFVSVTFLKGKLWMGWIGLFIPIVAWWGAIRLGRPGSVWARWRYARTPHKTARAEKRACDFQNRWGSRQQRLLHFISGVAREGCEEPSDATPGSAVVPPASTAVPAVAGAAPLGAAALPLDDDN